MEHREQREAREMIRDWFRFEERDARYATALCDAPSGPSRIEAELEAEPVLRDGRGAENA